MTMIMNSEHMIKAPVKRQILGIGITNASKEEVLEYIGEILKKKTKKLFVSTPNPEMVVAAQGHPELIRLLNNADVALCDGVGLLLAGYFLGKGLKERITGIDMMDLLCQLSVDQALSIGLLGARPGVAERAAECLCEKYPSLKIMYTASEWDSKTFPNDGLDILFVAYGFPKQELWIEQYLPKLPVRLAMGVGGSFDMISGEVRRAPFILRMIGFEWLYRLIRQPWRWRRQLALLSFIKLVFMAKLNSR